MKHAIFSLTLLATMLLLAACLPQKTNPAFRACANTCTSTKNRCVVGAFSTDGMAQCKATRNSCMASCDDKFPRYLAKD